ncbi:hypothetical protein ACAX46_001266 [Providencia rettgeri]
MIAAIWKVDHLLLKAERIIWMKINAEVTAVLQAKDNPATKFICAMGGWSFYNSDGEPLDGDEKYASTIVSLFSDYNETFKLCGSGFRWELVDGKVNHNGNW